jgi:phage baseplate assembly protein V
MEMLENLLRWVRVRSLKEGRMQTGRVEGLPNDARDDAQRPQDYGFAGQPVSGEGLKLEIGGHTVVIRLDRITERPELAEYEVAVWHKEGHTIKLKTNGVVEVTCTTLAVAASAAITMASPAVTINSAAVAINGASLKHNGVNVGSTHTHGGVQAGGARTAVPG